MPSEHENPEPGAIGELEAVVLSLVKALGGGSVSDILDRAKNERKMAYTTLSTTLDRLYKKGLLAREMVTGKGGQHYVYASKGDTMIQKEIVTRTIDRLVNAFGKAAVSNIYERLEQLSTEELEELEGMVSKRKESK